jgi:branched-chain amino acid transport system permease protein
VILVIQRVLDALSVGSTYALLALGLTLVYSVMNLINFAYGMMLVWSALIAVVLVNANLPAPLVLLACLVFSALLSVGVGRLAFQPFLTAPPVTLLITSFGVELVLQYAAIVAFGENPRILQVPPVFNLVMHAGGVRLPVSELTTIGAAVIVFALLYFVLNRTRFGMQIRAAAELPDIARLMGVSPGTVLTAVFAISGIIAGLVGVLWFAQVGAVTPRSDIDPTFKAFIAIVLGGLGNTRGAIVGGLALGAIEVFLSAVLPPTAIGYIDGIVFASVIAILLFRPAGLVGVAARL